MTKVFKAGDKVIRTESFNVGGDFGFMQKGREYVVKSMPSQLLLEVEGCGMRYDIRCFELVQPAFKAMKFRVYSPEQSKEIQEALFSMGYAWAAKNQQVIYLGSKWLTSWDDGSLGVDEHAFNLNTGEEHTLKTTKSYEFTPVTHAVIEETTEETIELMGQKYSKKELENALRGLKPIE